MESKPKACCADCELRCAVKNVMNKSVPEWLDYLCCEQYTGPGLAPQMEIDAAKKRIAELEAIDEKNTANLRRFQETLIEWKDKNNELSRKNSELEAECERLRTDENPTLLKGEEVIQAANKVMGMLLNPAPVGNPTVNGVEIEPETIAEILADWNRRYVTPLKSLSQFLRENKHLMGYLMKKANLSPFRDCVVGIETADGYLEETVGNPTDCVETTSAPVAKPIVWGVENYSDELSFEFEQSAYATFFQIHCFFRNEVLLGAWFAESKEAVVLKAQDWLNKLVAQCAILNHSKSRGLKSNSATQQFTAEDIAFIQDHLCLNGPADLVHANVILNKCYSILKGAQG